MTPNTTTCQHWNAIQNELIEESLKEANHIYRHLKFPDDQDMAQSPPSAYSAQEAANIIERTPALNEEQKSCVENPKGDLIILALAGTGKTRSLSARIAALLALGTDPHKIAVCSHTVSAAQEIQSRVAPTLQTLFPSSNADARAVCSGTLHALAFRELSRMNHPRGKDKIIEEHIQRKLWQEAKQFALQKQPSLPRPTDNELANWFEIHERIRNLAIAQARVPDVLKSITGKNLSAALATLYHEIKISRHLMDYSDLLRLWIPIIVTPGYYQRWEHVLVDEFQDNSPLQKFILGLLRYQGTAVTVCGDIRQSIASYNGSEPHAAHPLQILPGPAPAPVRWLQTNYRSTRRILELANSVLGEMVPKEHHTLQPTDSTQTGAAVRLTVFRDKTQEYSETIRQAEIAYENRQTAEHTIAILYRTNDMGHRLEEALALTNARRLKHNLPPLAYARKDSRKSALRERTERILSAILRAWVHPASAPWFDILTSPYFPGIGEVTASAIEQKFLRAKPQHVNDVWTLLEGEVPKRALATMGQFLLHWETADAAARNNNNQWQIQHAVSALGNWLDYHPLNKTLNASPANAKDIENTQRRAYETTFLQNLLLDPGAPLLEALKPKAAPQTPPIVLSTIHLAKGLEYDTVIIHNLSTHSLPHTLAIQEDEIPNGSLERRWRKYFHTPADNLPLDRVLEDPHALLPKIHSLSRASRHSVQDPNATWDYLTSPMEEEKRLLYVAITRARKELIITTRTPQSHPFLPQTLWHQLQEHNTAAEPLSV